MTEKILVIEDDPGTLRLLRHTLELEGYRVSTSRNGLQGLRMVQQEEPDLIVLDVMLPGLDGFELCHQLRAEPQTEQVPILMLSAKAREVDRSTGLVVGANDYLAKPADPAEIVSRVKNLLAQKPATKSRMIAFLGPKKGVGVTTILVNVAIALSQKGKQVVVVDLCPGDGNAAEHLGLKPAHAIPELLTKPAGAVSRQDLEAAMAVHHTGVELLVIAPPPDGRQAISASDLELLLERLRDVTDYILVDSPFQDSDAEEAVLTKCDLIIIVTDSNADGLPGIESTASLLCLSGILQERMSAVIIDHDAIFNEAEFFKMKSTIERSTGISLLGIIPYDSKASLELVPGGIPVTLSNPSSPIAWAIRGTAQHVIEREKELAQR